MGTLKPQNNGPLYINMVTGNVAVDERAVTFGTAWRGLGMGAGTGGAGWASAHPGKNQGGHSPPWKF